MSTAAGARGVVVGQVTVLSEKWMDCEIVFRYRAEANHESFGTSGVFEKR
jgi:hypothetical protein